MKRVVNILSVVAADGNMTIMVAVFTNNNISAMKQQQQQRGKMNEKREEERGE